MKKLLFATLFSITFSCSNRKEVPQIVEIACGQCQFSLNSEQGCNLAVRIDHKAYFVDGFDIDAFGDAHDEHTGFCEVIRKAEVSGSVQKDRFKASAMRLIENVE
ncbi:glutaminyl-tRNA synthetase [Polaribacter irgensii 23-P]|jgi:hypothetical protein|uniref:Glutaminyl-tRNA synthetase n=1 Tax=Polaribacter irgensii 23-P TaxID=313594 RepID=A4BXW9_9FLAO|nr:DUF6370 family protein [Polaribacter irgensii]EAR13810.1 glutaminyl-tRNA synthetase [Polaribacter irgensii 23-P]